MLSQKSLLRLISVLRQMSLLRLISVLSQLLRVSRLLPIHLAMSLLNRPAEGVTGVRGVPRLPGPAQKLVRGVPRPVEGHPLEVKAQTDPLPQGKVWAGARSRDRK